VQPYATSPATQPTPSLTVTGEKNMTWMWVLLCIVALGPCGLLLVGSIFLAFLPYAMALAGLALLGAGWMDYSRTKYNPHLHRIAKRGLAMALAGIALVIGAPFAYISQERSYERTAPPQQSSPAPYPYSYP
jgi:hypothetical protein